MRKHLLLLLLVLFPIWVSAQTSSIMGQVVDYDSGEPLIGATVTIKGTTTGVITDLEGNYEIATKKDAVLEFAYMGYTTKTVKVGSSRFVSVRLKIEAIEMDEVVAVGYGQIRKSDLTGAVASIGGDDLASNNSQTDITSALEGRVAGVMITATEGGPGAGMNIQIRGASSINANTDPLYVIDGFPMEISDVKLPTDGFNDRPISPIANIDPNNIESIEILKDASATAIYGARGANGVVLITTKSGKSGKTVVTLDASLGVQTVANTLDLMGPRQYAEYRWHRTMTGTAFNRDPYAETAHAIAINDQSRQFANYATYGDTIGTDWQDFMYKTSLSQNYALSVSGGTEKVQFSVNGSYLNDQGILDNNDFQRYTLDTKMGVQINDRLKMDFVTRLGHTISNGVSSGIGGNTQNTGVTTKIYRMNPLRDPFTELGDIDLEDEGVDSESELNNPYFFVRDVTNLTNSTRLLANMAFTYKLTKAFSYKGSVGTSHNLSKRETFYPSSIGKGQRVNGLASISQSQSRSWVHESLLNYNKVFNKKHRINGVLGFTIEEKYGETFGTSIQNFAYQELGTSNLALGVDPLIPHSDKTKNSLVSFLGRVNYSLMDKYLFTVSARADGSSRFVRGNRWSAFPSGSFAWRMSEEEWMKDQNVFHNFKWRASYGLTGNQGIGDFDVRAILAEGNYVFGDASTAGLILNRIDNPDLRWETTSQFDAGIDMGFLGNRLQLTLDYYYKKTVDMLMDIDVPATTGYDKFVMNYGDVQNQGFEATLFAQAVEKRNFKYDLSINVSLNRNKVLDLGGADYLAQEHTRLIVDKPIGQFWGYKQVGIIESVEEVEKYRAGTFANNMVVGQRKFEDIDTSTSTDEKIVIDNNDQTIIGSYEPVFYGGMSHNFNFFNFDLGLQFTFQYGGDIMNITRADLITNSIENNNRHSDALDFWSPTNPTSMNPHPAAKDLSDNVDIFVEDASHLRLSAVNFGYTFRNSRALRVAGISSIKLYFRGNNLFTLSGYSGVDPRAGMGGKLSPGLDKGGKPFTHSYSFGLNVRF